MTTTTRAIAAMLLVLVQDAAPAFGQDGTQPAATLMEAERPRAPESRSSRKSSTEPELRPAAEVRAGPSGGAGATAGSAARELPAPVQGMVGTGPTSRGTRATPIVCEPGQAVRYERDGGAPVWVTRSGQVTIDNPLRPLTPDTTRIVQLVVGDRLATAYGADFDALRRGASPASLEAVLGGPIRWDDRLATLPDPLNIVADSGASVAELPFRSCGDAPAVKPTPATRMPRENRKTARKPPVRPGSRSGTAPADAAPDPAGGTTARKPVRLPLGALPE